MIQLAPSILAADFSRLGDELQTIRQTGVEMVHIDVMDGMFVPSISLGMPVIQSIRKVSPLCFDVHLMVEEPGRYIDQIVEAGADIISVHVEACRHLHRTVNQIKDHNKKACVVLNPATPLTALDYVLENIDMVLLMTVNPGFGGQSYIPQMTEKIQNLYGEIKKRNLDVDIEVDGGIKLNNVREVLDAGANIIVGGSSVFGSNTKENVKKFQEIFAEYENK